MLAAKSGSKITPKSPQKLPIIKQITYINNNIIVYVFLINSWLKRL